MQEISQLVQSLIIIVMLAVFLELLLPSNAMHDYVKMIMGLLVIIAVLQAIFKFIDYDFHLQVPEISTIAEVSTEQVQANAQSLSEHYKSRAMEEYKQGIAKQVLALASLNQDVSVIDAQVELDSGEVGSLGKLQWIQLTVSDKERSVSGVQSVQPVEIAVGTKHPQSSDLEDKIPQTVQRAIANISSTVADFYNLSPDQVQVIYKK
ncbi:stage III sporulation protein AF [Peptococcaceae bacterium 1198_IL3148]